MDVGNSLKKLQRVSEFERSSGILLSTATQCSVPGPGASASLKERKNEKKEEEEEKKEKRKRKKRRKGGGEGGEEEEEEEEVEEEDEDEEICHNCPQFHRLCST
ncbi:hypothetical protein Cadr_000024479 [Camelus dromedarius]|uniref:Uncharacterized protein n=1 Tax=Camelus dromedarius TaxID=9838 RepID=A0A5N4CMQ6_CAMDR|nr:hypothetical protein Cadr_000024479 [Camelus dromedarius]